MVDDNVNLTTLLGRVLEKFGYEAIAVNDPTRAVSMARHCRVDLVLLDVMMPVMDGGDVLERLWADVDLRSIPVILLTALSVEAASLARLGGGNYPVVGKPVEFRELMMQIERSLGRVNPYPHAPAPQSVIPPERRLW